MAEKIEQLQRMCETMSMNGDADAEINQHQQHYYQETPELLFPKKPTGSLSATGTADYVDVWELLVVQVLFSYFQADFHVLCPLQVHLQ